VITDDSQGLDAASRNQANSKPPEPTRPVHKFLSEPELGELTEIRRRRDVLDKLRQEYILSHDAISPAIVAGTEQPPSDWVNRRLIELGEKWTIAESKKEKPDIGISLVYRKLPALMINNLSNATASVPKYSVILWNLDSDERNPLPIPVQVATGDYIVPQAGWGPNNILDTELVRPLRKEGDRLFGYIRVQCADCIAVRD
jgi:hypothetical protein